MAPSERARPLEFGLMELNRALAERDLPPLCYVMLQSFRRWLLAKRYDYDPSHRMK